MDYSEFDDKRIAHLEMIQAVVSRLSNEGFLVKGWAITVASALFGFAISSESWALASVAIGPTLAFWLLDMTFLRSERLFRELYSSVQQKKDQIDPFFMGATTKKFTQLLDADPKNNTASFQASFLRPSLLLLYGTIITTAVVISVVILVTAGSSPSVVPVRLV